MRTTHHWLSAVRAGALEALVLRMLALVLVLGEWVTRASWYMERRIVWLGDPAALQRLLPNEVVVFVMFLWCRLLVSMEGE